MVWYGMVCLSLPLYGMHWQWKWYGIYAVYGMVCIVLELYGMVWYALHCHCIPYHTIPFPCMVWYTIHVMHGISCISLPLYDMHWQWYGMIYNRNGNGMHFLAIVWYALAMV
jgi:hypothetical protein